MPNVEESLWAVYTATIKRGRWCLLATAFLSALLIASVYLDNFSTNEQELELIFANRAMFSLSTVELDSMMTSIADTLRNCQPDHGTYLAMWTKLKELSRMRLVRLRTDNTLAGMQAPVREVPRLGISASGSDYSRILVVTVTILSLICVLNHKAAYAMARELMARPDATSDLGSMIGAYYTFTGLAPRGADRRQWNRTGLMVERVSYWLAFYAILFSSVVGISTIFRDLSFGGSFPAYSLPSWFFLTVLIYPSALIITFLSARVSSRYGRLVNKRILAATPSVQSAEGESEGVVSERDD